jgi:hypothetical protein
LYSAWGGRGLGGGVITENQLNFIRDEINKIEHGKITIVIQDGCAKLDILTEKRNRILREDNGRQIELIEGGPPCKIKALRPNIRINNKKDEEYLTGTAKRM